MRTSSFGLSNLFEGRIGSKKCLAFLLSLKAPKNAKEYLVERHKRAFPHVDSYKNIMERWQTYPSILAANIKPVLEEDLSNSKFIRQLADRLSFDISRFTDFLEAYGKVAEDIKPVMLHYATIYLLDFFSRTWLKYGPSMSHGTKMITQQRAQNVLDIKVKIFENGIFPRAVDAFFLMYQPSLFSNDERHGVRYMHNIAHGGTTPRRFRKMQYSKEPQIKLRKLLEIYKELMLYENIPITTSNKILTGYLILFLFSSISRYKAKDWFTICNNRNLNNRIELLSHDFVSEWIPELLLQASIINPDPSYVRS